VSGKFYRFSPETYHVIGLMDGKLTVQELWERAVQQFGDDAPSQGDMVRVLSQLHSADILLCDVPPDTEELFSRYQKIERARWTMNLKSPLFLRFPLLDPDRFLSGTMALMRPFFSLLGFLVWLVLVGAAVVLAVEHWTELTHNVVDRLLSTQNLLLMGLVYPVIKTLHEFSHAYAVKRWGGEVHEMGIMLLVLMPIPYVDASSASAFPERRKRILVGAAGIMVELLVASLALFAWLNLDHGVARAIAFNIIIIASVSTVLFNANPLLRYDGYYILSDLLEIPNLAQRSIGYLGYLIKRYLFGLKKFDPPYVARGERFWLATYSIAAFVYRGFVYAAIILFISGKFFFVGIILAIWAVLSMLVIPVAKRIKFLLASPVLRERRVRAIAVSSAIIGGMLAMLFYMPFPSWTRAEGVVWVPEESLVRAQTSGFVGRIEAAPNSPVKKGNILIRCEDPLLDSEVQVLKAQLRALKARYDAEAYLDRVQARITLEEIQTVRANLTRAEEQWKDLVIQSPIDGIFVLPGAEDLKGRYLPQGSLIAYVLKLDKPTVRVVVSQSDVDLIRKSNNGIEVRLSEQIHRTVGAVIKREVPGAVEQLPSTVLGVAGGGEIAIDPRDAQGLKTLETLFQYDLELDQMLDRVTMGGRAYVRFDHGSQPLAFQWYRSLRQMFLRRFNV